MEENPSNRRVRVRAPRSTSSTTTAPYPVARELDEQSEIGELVLDSLIRSQLRLALVVGGGFLLILLGAPVLLSLVPQMASLRFFGVPAPWILLGVGVYPLVITCGALYIRNAQRNESRFLDLIDEE